MERTIFLLDVSIAQRNQDAFAVLLDAITTFVCDCPEAARVLAAGSKVGIYIMMFFRVITLACAEFVERRVSQGAATCVRRKCASKHTAENN